MIRRSLSIFAGVLIGVLFFNPVLPHAAAQGGLPPIPAEQCAPVLNHLWEVASNACINKPDGFICNGGAPPAVEPRDTLANQLDAIGALVPIDQVDALDLQGITIENASLGVAWMRLPEDRNGALLVIGDVTLYDVTPAGFSAWTSILMVTSPTPPTCTAAPANGVIIQTPVGRQADIVINGASLAVIGTTLVHTTESDTVFSMISGRATVFSQGQRQSLVAGQQVRVRYSPGNFSFPISAPTAPNLLDPIPLRNLPVALFERPLVLPQPAYLTTQGSINLRTAPDIYAAVLRELGGGEVMTLLGTNSGGDWYHVQLDSGETGWVFSELLVRNVGEISAVYDATPLPPQRLGDLGTRARVSASNGANLRQGPDINFRAVARVGNGTLVDLIARSPYSGEWLKVNVGGTVGWLSLFTLETQAFLEALPIDWNAPLPPAPPTATPIPGTSGNAFPDPDGEGNLP